jgi:rare lipoprotein A
MTLLLCLYTCCCLFGTPGAQAKYGLASYYGTDFHGKRTASGEIFDQWKLTCAHRELPFGTRLKVTNVENGRSVVVRVNDRGPWVAGRIVDLSFAAARRIEMVKAGVVKVKLEIVK